VTLITVVIIRSGYVVASTTQGRLSFSGDDYNAQIFGKQHGRGLARCCSRSLDRPIRRRARIQGRRRRLSCRASLLGSPGCRKTYVQCAAAHVRIACQHGQALEQPQRCVAHEPSRSGRRPGAGSEPSSRFGRTFSPGKPRWLRTCWPFAAAAPDRILPARALDWRGFDRRRRRLLL
jgi:hypothetical protein